MKVSVNEVTVHTDDMKSVAQTLEKGWFSSSGPIVSEFENTWAKFCDRKYGIAVSNGSTALLTAFLALNLTPGAEIIVPNFTIISCVSSIIQAGYTPIFVDCELDTFNIDINKIEDRITKKTEALLIVHIYGHPSQVVEIKALASKYKLKLIEDAAEAHGARYLDQNNKWITCGSNFEISTFSFFANKVITTGEGGMALTDDTSYAAKMKKIRNLYFPEEREYLHDQLGYQFRLGSMQAAFGISQIGRIEKTLEKKRQINNRYRANLKDLQHIRFQKISEKVESNYWVIAVLIEDKGFDSKHIRKELMKKEIETRPFFTGMHAQPALKTTMKTDPMSFSNTEYATKHGVILPSGVDTSIEQIDFVSEVLIDILK